MVFKAIFVLVLILIAGWVFGLAVQKNRRRLSVVDERRRGIIAR